MKYSKTEVHDSMSYLHSVLKPGSTVLTVLRNVSRSGMSRRIDLYTVHDNITVYLSGAAAVVMGDPRPTDGIKVGGCGMDMGFSLVYALGATMWPEGFAPSYIAIRPSDNKRVNVDVGRGMSAGIMTKAEISDCFTKGFKFEGGRNQDKSGWDRDGGYALKHSWL